jgi:hypothetical protein
MFIECMDGIFWNVTQAQSISYYPTNEFIKVPAEQERDKDAPDGYKAPEGWEYEPDEHMFYRPFEYTIKLTFPDDSVVRLRKYKTEAEARSFCRDLAALLSSKPPLILNSQKRF